MRTGVALLGVVALAVVAAGCDTGDGTTLRDPDADLPPPTDVPRGTSTAAEPDPLPSEPIEPVTTIAAPTSDSSTLPAPVDDVGFALTAPWSDGGAIDPRYGCDGLNASPPLAWNGVPDGTVELAVALVDSTDLSRGQPFVHWIVAGLAADTPGLVEDQLPTDAVTGLNFFGNVAYDGPCPALGTTSVYDLTLFALDAPSGVTEGLPAVEALDAILATAFDERTVTGSSTR